jgi:hypothetical protein
MADEHEERIPQSEARGYGLVSQALQAEKEKGKTRNRVARIEKPGAEA